MAKNSRNSQKKQSKTINYENIYYHYRNFLNPFGSCNRFWRYERIIFNQLLILYLIIMKTFFFLLFAVLTVLSIYQAVITLNSDFLVFSFMPIILTIIMKPSKN